MPRAAKLALAVVLLAGLLALQIVYGARALSGVVHETRGIAAERAGDHAAARAEFAQARAATPYSSEYARLEATAVLNAGDAEAAAPMLEESLRLAPNTPLTLTAAAETYLRLRQTDKAEAVIAHAARITPMEWRLNLMRGMADLDRNQYAPALTELTAAARVVAPPKYEVLYQLARAQYAYGNVLDASHTAERALRLQPGAVEAKVLYGKSLLSTERIAEAYSEFAYAEQVYFAQLGSTRDAELRLIEAQDLLSIALLAEGKFDAAYSKLDEMYPRLSAKQIDEFAWRLNDMTWRMREPFAPISLWRHTLDLLAQTKRLEEFDAAIETVRLMCTSPEFDTLAAARARAFTAGGNPEWALEVLANAPAELRNTAPWRLAHAEALMVRGRKDDARAEYEALLKLPGLSPAIQKQAKVALEQAKPQ